MARAKKVTKVEVETVEEEIKVEETTEVEEVVAVEDVVVEEEQVLIRDVSDIFNEIGKIYPNGASEDGNVCTKCGAKLSYIESGASDKFAPGSSMCRVCLQDRLKFPSDKYAELCIHFIRISCVKFKKS